MAALRLSATFRNKNRGQKRFVNVSSYERAEETSEWDLRWEGFRFPKCEPPFYIPFA
jgi:hypothetical protein